MHSNLTHWSQHPMIKFDSRLKNGEAFKHTPWEQKHRESCGAYYTTLRAYSLDDKVWQSLQKWGGFKHNPMVAETLWILRCPTTLLWGHIHLSSMKVWIVPLQNLKNESIPWTYGVVYSIPMLVVKPSQFHQRKRKRAQTFVVILSFLPYLLKVVSEITSGKVFAAYGKSPGGQYTEKSYRLLSFSWRWNPFLVAPTPASACLSSTNGRVVNRRSRIKSLACAFFVLIFCFSLSFFLIFYA